ncbi:hypothetical protein GQ53DRAFT_750838 [Thozetella sp. PMI_491]|nr:hypothetical protein GQ53DRAFT_750838 [Thozetella sp. PMI_491]
MKHRRKLIITSLIVTFALIRSRDVLLGRASPSPHNVEFTPVAAPPPFVAASPNLTAATHELRPKGDPLCNQLPGGDGIVVIVKTGASEAFSKIPTQLHTILRCAPDVLVFSDLEQTIAGVPVHDSFESVLDDVKHHPDFNLYHAQRACRVSQADCTRHIDKGKEGWALDKYKNIHIAEKAYNMRPGKDWYVVIDADTYMFWTTLVAFLSRLDPSRKLFLGSIAHYLDLPFAHGGSGYIMSRGAMDDFVGAHPGIANSYDKAVIETCCGDWMFAKAMMETSKIPVTQSFPTINGDKIWSMAFGPTHWCHPLATMHHVDSEEMSLFWEYEMNRHLEIAEKTSAVVSPVLLRDMYFQYFAPRVSDVRDDWDNISGDVLYLAGRPSDGEKSKVVPERKRKDYEKVAHHSVENCRTACEKMPDCFQYLFKPDEFCKLGKSFRIGYPMAPEKDPAKRHTAGWLRERIQAWVDAQGECESAIWPTI